MIAQWNFSRKLTKNKKDRWDSGKPRRQQIFFCDIQIKVVTSRRQIYVYHSDLLPLKIWVTLTWTFQGHSRSNFDSAIGLPIWFPINV